MLSGSRCPPNPALRARVADGFYFQFRNGGLFSQLHGEIWMGEHPGNAVRVDGAKIRLFDRAPTGAPRHVLPVILQPTMQLPVLATNDQACRPISRPPHIHAALRIHRGAEVAVLRFGAHDALRKLAAAGQLAKCDFANEAASGMGSNGAWRPLGVFHHSIGRPQFLQLLLPVNT
jgi:hypothetical protein